MAYLSLDPVSVAVYGKLNVAGLTALVSTGGISDDVTQARNFPYVWYELFEARDVRGFGTGGLPEVQLRVHAYGKDLVGLQAIVQKCIELLKDQALTVTGYSHCGHVFYDETSPPLDELINGVKVWEIVALFRIYVEEAA